MRRGEILRTGKTYKFRLRAEVWLSNLRAEYNLDGDSFLYSEGGEGKIAVQILFCPIGTYCTPFIFEHDLASSSGHASHASHNSHDSHDDHRALQHLHSYNETEDIHYDSHDGDGHSLDDAEELHVDFEDGHDSHDDNGSGEHLHIESEQILLEYSDRRQDIFSIDFSKDVTVDFPGSFVPLAHIQFFLTNGTAGRAATEISGDDVLFKVDVANTLHEGLVSFEAPPIINEVSRGVEIFSYIAIFVVGAFELVLLFLAIKHRSHSVFKLSQGIFLIVAILSAFIASTSTFLFNPKSDAYCRTYGPLIMIPLQLMLAVIVGRLHRIIAVMSPLMTWQNDQYKSKGRRRSKRKAKKKIGKMLPSWAVANAESSSKSLKGSKTSSGSSLGSQSSESSASEEEGGAPSIRMMRRMRKATRGNHTKTLKVEFTERRLWLLIAIMSLPQIIIQIIGLAVYPQSTVVTFNVRLCAGSWLSLLKVILSHVSTLVLLINNTFSLFVFIFLTGRRICWTSAMSERAFS